MSDPLVSVIMPCFNSERFIAKSIDSVIAQTVDDWELIIVDDASTDGTTAIAAAYQRRDSRIRMIPQTTNQGPASARNLGLDHAHGELIAFIDSDDIWRPEKTSKQVAAMQRYQADISYTGYERRRESRHNGVIVSVPASIQYQMMLRHNWIGCSTALVRRATCGRVRMPLIKRRQDHGYWLELLRDGSRTAVGIKEPLVWYGVRRGSLSANKLVAAAYSWKLLRDVERFPIGKSLWLFGGYVFEHLRFRLLSSRRRGGSGDRGGDHQPGNSSAITGA